MKKKDKLKKIMDTLDLLKKIEDFNEEHLEVFGNDSFLDEWVSDLWGIILDSYGIPEDNTKDYKDLKYADENMFCRDYWTDLLFDYGSGRVSKEKLVEELKNWNK